MEKDPEPELQLPELPDPMKRSKKKFEKKLEKFIEKKKLSMSFEVLTEKKKIPELEMLRASIEAGEDAIRFYLKCNRIGEAKMMKKQL